MVSYHGFQVVPNDVYREDKFECNGEVYICLDRMPTNNGNFKAVDFDGRLKWFNTVTDDIKLQYYPVGRQCVEATQTERASNPVIRISNPVRFHATWDDLDRLEDMCLPNDTDL